VSEWRKAERWNQWLNDLKMGVEVVMHSEREPKDFYDFPRMWNTYLLFSDSLRFSRDGQLCDPYCDPCPITSFLWENREAINGLDGWNGGPTFHEFVTDQHGIRRIKIGDDFQHLWDMENRRFDLYNLGYMQRHVLKVASEAAETIRLLMNQAKPSGGEG
jgi:hypothetical protein